MRIQIKILFLLLALGLKAQDKLDLSKALKVGQELPVLPALPVLNYQSPIIDWDEIKDKVIILDFFDTFCSNCIRDMPKLQKLQDELSDKLQIVLVTWQDKETIEKFYTNNAYLKKNKVHLPTIYGDTLLKSYFPHKGVPHTAWLFQNRVQAITFADFSTAENIRKLYDEGIIKLPLKFDFSNEDSSLIVSMFESNSITSLQISGYKDGALWQGLKMERDSVTNISNVYFHNSDIFGAYVASWAKIKKPTFLLKEERVVWKVKDPNRYRYLLQGGKNEWLLDNGISYYRSYSREMSPERQAEIVISDLNTALGLSVYWSEKEKPCLILNRLSNVKKMPMTEDANLEGTSVLAFMIDYQDIFPPVIDEVNLDIKMNINDFSSLEKVNEQLAKYGLVLKEEIRMIEVLVFEEVR